MDEAALYDVRLELVDFAIGVLWDVPDEEFVEALLSGEVSLPADDVLPALDDGFAELERFRERNRERSLAAVMDDLEVAYSRTFVGPRPPVVAHESYYREGTEFLGEGLADVQAAYEAAGWSSPEEYPEEDDFVAVELAFLRHLIERQRAGAEEAVGYERVFLDEHAGVWVEEFAEDVLESTDEELLRAGALVTQGLVALEDELIAGTAGG